MAIAREIIQSTIGSLGTEVDFDVRVCWSPSVPDWSATAESEKVFLLQDGVVTIVCLKKGLGREALRYG